MSERNPFQQNPGQKQLPCEEWEALLADALDGTLTPESETLFTAHGTNCPMCAEMLAQAKQGQEWMQFLHEEPPVPSDLVSKILDRTSGASLPQLAAVQVDPVLAIPVVQPQVRFSVRNSFRDSRILMTAAMAFFSIALTLNLVGIRLDTVRMADLKPSALQTNVARQFFRTRQQMVSYYEGLRLVYELESKMRELRQDADTEQNTQPKKNEKPSGTPQGNAHPNGGRLQPPHRSEPVIACGEPELATVETPENGTHPAVEESKNEEISKLVVKKDQAERSLA